VSAGTALDHRIIGDDGAFAAQDLADPGDEYPAVIPAVGDELRQFEEGRARIEQRTHPLARQRLAATEVPAPGSGPAALTDHCDLVAQILDMRAHHRRIRREAPVE